MRCVELLCYSTRRELAVALLRDVRVMVKVSQKKTAGLLKVPKRNCRTAYADRRIGDTSASGTGASGTRTGSVFCENTIKKKVGKALRTCGWGIKAFGRFPERETADFVRAPRCCGGGEERYFPFATRVG